MNILYVHPVNINYPGGSERLVVELLTRLRQRGHKVGVLHAKWIPHTYEVSDNSSELLRNDIKLYECNCVKFKRGFPIVNPSYIIKLSKNYDLLYISAYAPNELLIYTLRKLRMLNLPIIAVFHNMLEPHIDSLHKLYMAPYVVAYRNFDRLHVLNEFMYNLFVKRYRVDKSKVTLIPNGVDTTFFKLLSDTYSCEVFTVLYVSRLTREKGIDVFYKIVSTFNKRCNELKKHVIFKIAGFGPLVHYIKKLTNLYDNVLYLGRLSREQLLMEYNSAHALLMTSRIESMPLTLLEASACGLPVIASAIPGIIDVSKTVGYGVLVRHGDIEGYIKGITSLYSLWRNGEEEYHRIRIIIRQRTAVNYSWDVVLKKIEKMLIEVISNTTQKQR